MADAPVPESCPAANRGKVKIKIPIIPKLVSYETELRPDSFLVQLWRRSSVIRRVGLALALLLVIGLFGLGGWRLFRATAEPRTEKPGLYAVRVVVLGPDLRPVEDSEIRTSAGNEPQRVAGGWEIEIPRAKVPEDGKLTFWAEHPVSGSQGTKEILLGDDPTPSAQIRLRVLEATVRGTVLGPDRRALSGARVSVSGYGDESVFTEKTGTFQLLAHAPRGDRVRIRADHPDYLPQEVFCWAGSSNCELRLGQH